MAADLWVRPASNKLWGECKRVWVPFSPLAHWDATAGIRTAVLGSNPCATTPGAAPSIQKQKVQVRGDQAKGFVYSIDRPLPEGFEWGTLAKQLINSLRSFLSST
eukprot:3305520-Pyramimonas_sp.AAC.1